MTAKSKREKAIAIVGGKSEEDLEGKELRRTKKENTKTLAEYRKPTPRKKRLSKDAGAEAIQKAKAKAGGSGKMTRKMTGSGY